MCRVIHLAVIIILAAVNIQFISGAIAGDTDIDPFLLYKVKPKSVTELQELNAALVKLCTYTEFIRFTFIIQILDSTPAHSTTVFTNWSKGINFDPGVQ